MKVLSALLILSFSLAYANPQCGLSLREKVERSAEDIDQESEHLASQIVELAKSEDEVSFIYHLPRLLDGFFKKLPDSLKGTNKDLHESPEIFQLTREIADLQERTSELHKALKQMMTEKESGKVRDFFKSFSASDYKHNRLSNLVSTVVTCKKSQTAASCRLRQKMALIQDDLKNLQQLHAWLQQDLSVWQKTIVLLSQENLTVDQQAILSQAEKSNRSSLATYTTILQVLLDSAKSDFLRAGISLDMVQQIEAALLLATLKGAPKSILEKFPEDPILTRAELEVKKELARLRALLLNDKLRFSQATSFAKEVKEFQTEEATQILVRAFGTDYPYERDLRADYTAYLNFMIQTISSRPLSKESLSLLADVIRNRHLFSDLRVAAAEILGKQGGAEFLNELEIAHHLSKEDDATWRLRKMIEDIKEAQKATSGSTL